MDSSSDSGIASASTRRGVLKRFASAGMLATAGAGLVALSRPAGARARTAMPRGIRSDGVLAKPDCCADCTIAENHCNPSCGVGYCCYYCTGTCGTGYSCWSVCGAGCAFKSFSACGLS
jgi:hypothetical protein